ncbi:MAG TPA: cyclic pyranopterin monophosphate synthase MoaC [Syntrophobacteraceae bacterium]|nr:cyclic pyranopterin monophosphate synthase MoaC [Syntrophobacteraceae bacterium]
MDLTHIDEQGRLRMVNVGEKEATLREAHAEATVVMAAETLNRILSQKMPKGNVFEAARLAGIMAAKRTWELIPLCHPVQLTHVEVDFFPDDVRSQIRITSLARALDRTGVEMEALVAATHAALTVYDMCKAVDRGMTIRDVQLTFKTGGKSGTYHR